MLGERWIKGTRPPSGEWRDGHYRAVQGDQSESLQFRGSVQPASPVEVELIEEGERTEDVQAIMTKFRLRAADEDGQTPADLVNLKSQNTGVEKTFKVVSVKDLSDARNPIPHYRVLVSML